MNTKHSPGRAQWVADLLDEQEREIRREERFARLVAVAAMVAFGLCAALVVIGAARLARPCECSTTQQERTP